MERLWPFPERSLMRRHVQIQKLLWPPCHGSLRSEIESYSCDEERWFRRLPIESSVCLCAKLGKCIKQQSRAPVLRLHSHYRHSVLRSKAQIRGMDGVGPVFRPKKHSTEVLCLFLEISARFIPSHLVSQRKPSQHMTDFGLPIFKVRHVAIRVDHSG